MTSRRHRRYHGIFLLDVLTALILMVALGTVLMVAINRTAGASEKLSNDREALEAAQRTLLALEQHKVKPNFDSRVNVIVESLNDGWVKVSVAVDDRTATLTGWVGGAK